MKTENEQLGPPTTKAELDKINGIEGKPEGLTPEESQRWDDIEHDMKLLRDDALAPASAFKVLYKEGR